jgi:autotransporter-associated beta strand protein
MDARARAPLVAFARRQNSRSLLETTALVALSFAVLFEVRPAHAQSTWQTGSGVNSDYNEPTNWDTATPPVASGQSAIFSNSGSAAVGVSGAPIAPDAWTFTADSQATYSISGSDVNFSLASTAGGIVNNANAGQTITIANNIGESVVGVQVQQLGNSTLVLSGTNTYTGDTTINVGTVQVTNNSAVGTVGNVVFGGGTFQAGAAGLSFANTFVLAGDGTVDTNGNTLTLTGPIIGSGAFTKTGTGTLIVDQAGNSGVTNVNQGRFKAGQADAFSSASDYNVAAGAFLDVGGFDQSIQSLVGGGTVTNGGTNSPATLTVGQNNTVDTTPFVFSGTIKDGAGTSKLALTVDGTRPMILTGTNTYTGGTLVCDCATLQLGNGGTTGSIMGNVSLGGTLIFDRSNTYTFTGVISDDIGGHGQVVQAGDGTTILTRNNTYSGGTTISAGTLQLGNGGTTGSIVGPVLDNGILAFDRSNTVTFNGLISGSGQVNQIGTGTLILTNANTYAGGTLIANGSTLRVTNSTPGVSSSVGTGTVTLDNGQFQAGGANLSFSNNFAINNTTVGSAIDTNGRRLTISGNITDGNGPGALTVRDSTASGGVLVLTGANTYTGGTTICNCATLQLGTVAQSGSMVGPVDNEGVFNVVNSSSAGITTITNESGASLRYLTSSSAGSATIVNKAGSETDFLESSTAGTAAMTNRSGATIIFQGSSMAGAASITNRFGGSTRFLANSSADNATITNNSPGGGAQVGLGFFGMSTAGNATITTNNRGVTAFFANSTGGNAQFINTGGGVVDFSGSLGPNNDGQITAGSIAGSGFYYIGAGNTLTVGGNNLSTEVTGVIADTCGCGPSAPGALVKVGTGTLTLSGPNTYSGGTTVAGGTLAIVADNGIGTGPLALLNGTTLQFLAGFAFTHATTVSGDPTIDVAAGSTVTMSGVIADGTSPGNVVKTDGGTLIFTAANTYTGGTMVNGGTLQLGAGGSLAPTGSLAVNTPGTFDLNGHTQTVGDLSGDGAILLGGGTLTAGTSNSTTWAGVMSGTGGFVKQGTGTMLVTGTNTYTGPTTVNGGTLSVNGSIAASSGLDVDNGATVGGNGTLPTTRINAGGTLSPGNSIGLITVFGNLTFVGAGNYLVEVSPTAADRTNVTGMANLAGAVQAHFLAGAYIAKTYTILSAAGGLSGTTFNTLTTAGLPAGFTASLSYNATDAILNLTAVLGQPPPPPPPGMQPISSGLPTNQQNVATALNTYFNNGGTLPPNFVAVFGLTGASLTNGLAQLSGEVATSAAVAGFQDMGQFLELMLDPFLENRVGGNAAGFGAPALAFAPGEGNAGLPDAASAYARMPVKAPPPAPAPFDARWTVWGAAYGASGTFNSNAAIGSHDLTARSGGFAGGIDYRLGPNTVIGFAASGSSLSYSLDGGLGSGTGDAFKAGVYASTRLDNAYLSASAAYGSYDLTTSRSVLLPGFNDHLTGDVTAQAFGARIETGYRFPVMASSGITPYAAFQAQSFHLPGYGEADATGLAAFALAYNGHTLDEERSELGVRFDSRLAVADNSILLLRGRLAWAHEFSGTPALDAAVVTLPGASFTVFGAGLPRDALLVSAGPELRLPNGWTLRAKFDGSFAGQSQTYAGTGVLRFAW